MAMIMGIWGNIILVCGNHKEQKQPEMVVEQGPYSLFYACPKHHIEQGEMPCYNLINLIDYDKMIDHISNELIKADEKGEKPCLLHHKWKRKSQQFEVIEHTPDKLVIEFVDTLAIKGHKVM